MGWQQPCPFPFAKISVSDATPPLGPLGDMPPDALRQALHRMADWVADYRETIASRAIVPAVQPGRDLLRTSYMATHEDQQLDTILRIVKEVDAEMDLSMTSAENATPRPGMPWMSSPS